MEKKQNKIDAFFKDNLSGFEVSDGKGNWDLLNRLLIAQKKKRKNRKILFFILLCAGGFTAALLTLNIDKTSVGNTAVSDSAKNSSSELGTHGLTNPAVKYNEMAGNEGQQVNEVQQNEIKLRTGTTIDEPVSSDKINAGNAKENKLNDALKNSLSVERQIKNVNSERLLEQKSVSGSLQVIDNNQLGVVMSEESNTPDYKNSGPDDSGNSAGNTPVFNKPDAAKKQQSSNMPEETIFVNPVIVRDSIPGALPITNWNIPNSNTVMLQTQNKVDSANTETSADSRRFLNYNLYAGVNIYRTDDLSGYSEKQNISPFAGVEITHSINSKIAIGVAGLYSLQGGYHLTDTAYKEAYFLDKNSVEKSIQIHKMHKLYFPLTFYYTPFKRHSFSAAIQLSYLLNTSGDLTEKNYSSGETIVSEKHNVKGYINGIHTTNIAGSLGYRYALSRRFDVSIRATRDFTETFTDGYFYGISSKPGWTFQSFAIFKF